MNKGLKWGLTALALVVANGASGAEIYRCVSQDKKIIFSDRPCLGAKPAKPIASNIPDTRNFTNNQVNTAYDCMEALDSLIYRDANAKAHSNVSASEYAQMRSQFDKLCPAVGFKAPDSPSTRPENLDFAERLRKNLINNNHTGPTFTRTYEGGRRTPPVFSGY